MDDMYPLSGCCYGCEGEIRDDLERQRIQEAPLAAWERELLTGYQEGEGDVHFVRTDETVFTIKKVRVDSIGPNAENAGVIAVETFDEREIIHVPFVQHWTITYP